jgi:hypothetical protein
LGDLQVRAFRVFRVEDYGLGIRIRVEGVLGFQGFDSS